MKISVIILVSFLLLTNISNAQNWIETAQSTLSVNDSTNQYYGKAVAIDGDYSVVGAWRHDNSTGKVAVLYFNGTSWDRVAELTASDAESGDRFGYSVDISGDNIIIGSYRDDDNGNSSGSAYIFTKPINGWTDMTQTAKLLPSDGTTSEYFGFSVAIYNENAVVGVQYGEINGVQSGSAYVFTMPTNGWADMTETAKLVSSDIYDNDQFGVSVSIYEDDIVVGAVKDDDSGLSSGSVYVFTKPNSGWINMTETAKLLSSDGETSDLLGISVDIYKGDIIAGAYFDDIGNETKSGSAYVFSRSGTTWENMTETAKLIPSDGIDSDLFGYTVSITNAIIAISSNQDDDNGNLSGSVYVFNKVNNVWTNNNETDKLIASDGLEFDRFGSSVAISGGNIVIGAFGNDDNGGDSGKAYLFRSASVGISESKDIANFTAFPNPASNYILIRSEKENLNNIAIINTLGQDVTSSITPTFVTNLEVSIDLTNLSNGVYFIIIYNEKSQTVLQQKIIKE